MGIIPSAVLIFVVLGTMMLGLATPTEAGAMGAIGAIVLAAIHDKEFSTRATRCFSSEHDWRPPPADQARSSECSAAKVKLFCKPHSRWSIIAVVWLCIEAVAHPGPAQPDQAGLRIDDAPLHHGGVHPDRLDLLLGGVPRRLRRRLARAPSDLASRRRLGLPDLHQPLHLLPGVLPRLLRDRLHHPADGGADRAENAGAAVVGSRMPR
jgi:hypothetical protein